MAAVKFTLNGKSQTVDVAAQMPLLWVLRDELGLTRAARELVPRTYQLTVIASVDPIADGPAELERDGAGQLDREI